MEAEDLAEFENLWTTDAEHYVLLRTSGTDDLEQCSIYDKRAGGILIIEDDEVADAVETRMKDSGVPVVDHVPELPIPEHIRKAMELKASATKKWWQFWKK